MNQPNIDISRFAMRCETCFLPLGEDGGCHYPECSDPCPPRNAVDSLSKVSGGPNPPAPHDWQKRFQDYESQLTDLREKLKVAEATLKKYAGGRSTEWRLTDNGDEAQDALAKMGEIPTSNPIAERAVDWMKTWGAGVIAELYRAGHRGSQKVDELIEIVSEVQSDPAILSQLQEKPL